jgi:hypothetical protein
MAERLRELRSELSQLDERRTAVLTEIQRIQSVATVVREFDPFTVLDEQSPSPFADLGLKSKTLAEACEAILGVKGEPASSRDLLDILVAEGKLAHGKNSSLISVINALKNHPDRFSKQGSVWALKPALGLSRNGERTAKTARTKLIDPVAATHD